METVFTVSLGLFLCAFLALVALVLWASHGQVAKVMKFAHDALELAKAPSLEAKVNADLKRDTYELNKAQMLDALNIEIERAKAAAKDRKETERNNFVTSADGRVFKPSQLEEVGPAEIPFNTAYDS